MAFEIRITDKPVPKSWDISGRAAVGYIEIGDFSETIAIPLFDWSKEEYVKQWKSALQEILNGKSRTALITKFYDPTNSNYVECWPLYRGSDSEVFVHNHLIFLDELNEPFEISKLADYIGEREADINEEPASEWETSTKDLANWLSKLE